LHLDGLLGVVGKESGRIPTAVPRKVDVGFVAVAIGALREEDKIDLARAHVEFVPSSTVHRSSWKSPEGGAGKRTM